MNKVKMVVLQSDTLHEDMMKDDPELEELLKDIPLPEGEKIVRQVANVIQTDKAYYYALFPEHLKDMYHEIKED